MPTPRPAQPCDTVYAPSLDRTSVLQVWPLVTSFPSLLHPLPLLKM